MFLPLQETNYHQKQCNALKTIHNNHCKVQSLSESAISLEFDGRAALSPMKTSHKQQLSMYFFLAHSATDVNEGFGAFIMGERLLVRTNSGMGRLFSGN